MNVLSLFDGMSCGQIALNKLGVKIKKYYASEIDKHAITVTKANYPDTVHLGDVTKWKEWDIDWSSIDLLLAGSPCQGFSMAGKQLAFDDPRSALFFVFVDIWKHIKKHNPKAHYLLENVRMKQEHEHVISRIMEVEPIVINSALLSAQNRVRLYWTNIYNQPVGLFGFNQCMIPQPNDKGVYLKDVLEQDVDEKYFIKNPNMLEFVTDKWRLNKKYTQINGEKGITQQARQYQSWCGDYIAHSLQPRNAKGQGGKGRLSKTDQKTYCVDTGNCQAIEYIVAMRGRNPENPSDRTTGAPTEQRLEPKTDGKTNCLTSVQKDNLLYTQNYVQWDVSGKGHKSQQDRAFYEDGKHGTLASSRPESKNGVLTQSRIRRLTPIECERLQTVPDNYTNHVSDTQRYKMLGNGWTVDVIAHILSYLN